MTAVIIAVRGGCEAKMRLAGVLGADRRQSLVAAMLEVMLRSIGARRCIVVSPTPNLLALAADCGATPFVQIGGDLNDAFETARVGHWAGHGAGHGGATLLLPGDLPLIRAADVEAMLEAVERADVVLSPAFADQGTAALAIGPGVDYPPSFGPDSFARHQRLARARGLSVATLRRVGLGQDIDRPEDLKTLAEAARTDPGLAGIAQILAQAPRLAEAV